GDTDGNKPAYETMEDLVRTTGLKMSLTEPEEVASFALAGIRAGKFWLLPESEEYDQKLKERIDNLLARNSSASAWKRGQKMGEERAMTSKAASGTEIPERTTSAAYPWYVAGILSLAYCFSAIDARVLTLLVIPIKEDLALTDFQISLLQGFAFALFY